MVKEVKANGKRFAKFCPNCKSLDIDMELSSGWFIGFPASYKCNSCGRKSRFFPEVDVNEIKKKNGKK